MCIKKRIRDMKLSRGLLLFSKYPESRHQFANLFQLAGTSKIHILFFDKFRVLFHENLAGIAEIKNFGMVPEEFAVDASPHQTTVGINVNFSDAQL